MEKKAKAGRERRKKRVRRKIFGTSDRPRLSVYRSLKHMYAQLIDDISGHTLLTVSTLNNEFKKMYSRGNNKKAASLLGGLLAREAERIGVKKVKFDRGRFSYHGRIKALADSAREHGMIF